MKSNNFHRENQFLAQITANHFLFNLPADRVITVITYTIHVLYAKIQVYIFQFYIDLHKIEEVEELPISHQIQGLSHYITETLFKFKINIDYKSGIFLR